MGNFSHRSLAGGAAARHAGRMAARNDPGPAPAGYHVFETAAGMCGLAWSAAGLTQVQLPEATTAATEARLARRSGAARCDPPPAAVLDMASRVRAYFDGTEVTFADAALDLAGISVFNANVYTALRAIGWGQATSYGALAKAVGAPGSARAIGAAMGSNPWPLIVPCHRVLAASGKIGGFSAHGGRGTKRRMLQLERIDADGAAPLLPGLFD